MTDVAVPLSELPTLCTVAEAAKALRQSVYTVHRYIAAGRFRAARLDSGSSRVLIPRSELERLVSEALM
jgi:excisionase family DNA binding protein